MWITRTTGKLILCFPREQHTDIPEKTQIPPSLSPKENSSVRSSWSGIQWMGLREFGPKYLEIGSVLLHVLLHAQAELLDPLPLGVHSSAVGLWKTWKRALEKEHSQPGGEQLGHRSWREGQK